MKTHSLNLRTLALVIVSTAILSPAAHADTLLGYHFSGTSSNPSQTSTTTAPGVTPASFTLNGNLTLNDTYKTGPDYGINTDAAATTLSIAEKNSDYIGFTIAPVGHGEITFSDLHFYLASFNANTELTLTDSSENVLGSAEVFNSSSNTYSQSISLAVSNSPTFDTSESFRLYISGLNGNGAGAPVVFNPANSSDTFDINGTIVTPEPSTFALFGLGALALILAVRRKLVR